MEIRDATPADAPLCSARAASTRLAPALPIPVNR